MSRSDTGNRVFVPPVLKRQNAVVSTADYYNVYPLDGATNCAHCGVSCPENSCFTCQNMEPPNAPTQICAPHIENCIGCNGFNITKEDNSVSHFCSFCGRTRTNPKTPADKRVLTFIKCDECGRFRENFN